MMDITQKKNDNSVEFIRPKGEEGVVDTSKTKKETQIIAIYGKGGIGKSFTLANLSYMMAQTGKKSLINRV